MTPYNSFMAPRVVLTPFWEPQTNLNEKNQCSIMWSSDWWHVNCHQETRTIILQKPADLIHFKELYKVNFTQINLTFPVTSHRNTRECFETFSSGTDVIELPVTFTKKFFPKIVRFFFPSSKCLLWIQPLMNMSVWTWWSAVSRGVWMTSPLIPVTWWNTPWMKNLKSQYI